MSKFIKKYITEIGLFVLVLCATVFVQNSGINIGPQSAAVIDLVNGNSTTKPASNYAWNDNIGWINFGTPTSNENGRVYVSGTKLYGYAWGENVGWISMNCENDNTCGTSNYVVRQNSDSSGTLTGYAWGENVGWINFAPTGGGVTVTTNTAGTNTFSGYAWGENIGWLSFSGTGYGVTTTWTKPSSSGGDGAVPAINNCNYEYSVWTTCFDGEQTRTVIPDPSQCGNSSDILSRNCTTATSTATTTIGISVLPTATTTFIGSKVQFTATVTGTTTNNGVTWILADENSGEIDQNGLYTAPLTGGIFHIIARAKADITKTVIITVDVRLIPPGTPISISLSPTESTIFANETLQFTAIVTGTTTNNLVNWTIIPVETIIYNFYGSISDTGLYTAPDHAVNITVLARPRADTTKVASAEVEVKLATSTPKEERVVGPPLATDDSDSTAPSNTNRRSNDNSILPSITSALDISDVISNNISVLGTTSEKIYREAKLIVESPVGSAVTRTLTTTGVVVGGGVAATSIFALNATTIADLLFLPLKLWGLLLSALGLKKRNRPWGTVYDSITKQPIDPAYVTLTNLKTKEEIISITDLDGRFGFLVMPGEYTITANKTNYVFPSKKLTGKTVDTLYNNLYFGGKIKIDTAGTLLNKNIPLDPLKFDWNEFVKGKKKLMKFYSRREKIIRGLTDWIFRVGFIISLLTLFLVSAPYNLIIFGLYLVLYALRKMGLKQKALGALTKDGDPLSFAIVRVFYSDLKTEITSKVADKIGKYYCLVPKGSYFVKIEKKKDDETYEEIYTSPVFEASNGIINKNFSI